MPLLTIDEVKAMLAAERADTLNADDASELSVERASSMDYYLGDMSEHMPAQLDRSQAVSTDVGHDRGQPVHPRDYFVCHVVKHASSKQSLNLERL
jgi:hypothetical protein